MQTLCLLRSAVDSAVAANGSRPDTAQMTLQTPDAKPRSSPRSWPRHERPREKLLDCGPSALSDAELLAVLLGTGVQGANALDVARELLARFGSLRALLTAAQADCLAQRGLGTARYALLQAALELARRHYRARLSQESAPPPPLLLPLFTTFPITPPNK